MRFSRSQIIGAGIILAVVLVIAAVRYFGLMGL